MFADEYERSRYGDLDPAALNNTKKANKDLLFFNRVPKVGSQTTMELIKTLAIKNDFHYHKDRTQKVETIKLTRSEEVRIFIDNNGRDLARLNIVCFNASMPHNIPIQKWLTNLLSFFSPPSVYVKHVCFVNFTQ